MIDSLVDRQAGEWLALRAAEGIRPATVKAYREHIHIFLKWLAGRKLTPITFAAFFREYGDEHSIASCQTIYTSMRAFLRGIDRADLVGRMRKPVGTPPPKTIYTPGQLRALYLALETDRSPIGLRDTAVVHLLHQCGLRVSEVCGLCLDDFLVEEAAFQVRDGKSHYARRIVPLVHQQPIDAYLARGRPHLLRDELQDECPYIFLTVKGGAVTRNTLRQVLKRRAKQVGFPLSAHRFRHTWATAHVRSRTNPTTIGRLAGWSPKTLYEMLQVYGHPDLDDLRRAQRAAFK